MNFVPMSQEAAGKKKQKDMRSKRFPTLFKKPVDLKRVDLEVIDVWIKDTIERLLGSEDDIVINFIKEMLADGQEIKEIYFQLEGFLADRTLAFCTELWELLLEAQESRDGVPGKLKKVRSKIVNGDRRSRSVKSERRL